MSSLIRHRLLANAKRLNLAPLPTYLHEYLKTGASKDPALFQPELGCAVLTRTLQYRAFQCTTVKRLLLETATRQRLDTVSSPTLTVVPCVHCPPHTGDGQQRPLDAEEPATDSEAALGTATVGGHPTEGTQPCQA